MRSIGTVYVTVLANSTNFTDKVKKDAEKAGHESGEKYAKGFAKEFNKIERDPEFDRAAKNIAQDWEALAKRNGLSLREGLRDARISEAMEADLEELADRFGLTTKRVAKEIRLRLKAAFTEVEREAERAAKEYNKAWDEAHKMEQDRIDDLNKAWDRAYAEQKDRDEKAKKETERREKETLRLREENARKQVRLVQEYHKAWRLAHEEQARRMRDEGDDVDRLGSRWRNMNGHLFRDLSKLRQALKRSGTGGFFDTLTNVLGGLVGLGGAAGKALSWLTETAFKGVGKTFEFAGKGLEKFGESLAEMGAEGLGGFVKNIGGAVSGFGSLVTAAGAGAAALVALGAILLVLETLLGAVVALVSALAGMVVILASAVSYAIGYLLVLGPLFMGLAAAAGVLMLSLNGAFGAMGKFNDVLNATDPTEKAKALKAYRKELQKLGPAARDFVKGMEPILTVFDGLQDRVSEKFFKPFADSMGGLAKPGGPIDILGKGLSGVASSLGFAVAHFIKLTEDKTFLDLWAKTWESLAPIVGNMGKGFGDLLIGLSNFFSAVAPFAERLSGWFASAMESFNKWTASKEGQKAITDFLTDAEGAAKAVAGAIGAIISAFATLLGPEGAQKDGLDFLGTVESLATKFKDWIEGVTKDGTLKAWLDEAKTVAGNIGDAVKTIADTFVALNTEKNREGLNKLIGLMSGFLSFVNWTITAIETLWGWFTKPFDLAGSWLGSIQSAIAGLPSSILGGLHFASGGIVMGPQRALVGEAGPEAIVPLTRPLGMIDPSVRGMAALIRGGMASTPSSTVTSAGKVVNLSMHVTPQSADPAAVAQQVMNRAVVLTR